MYNDIKHMVLLCFDHNLFPNAKQLCNAIIVIDWYILRSFACDL